MHRVVPPQRIIYQGRNQYLELRAPDVSQVPQIVDAIAETKEQLKTFMPWSHAKQTTEVQLERMSRILGAYWRMEDMCFTGFSESGDFVCGTGLHKRVPLNPLGCEIGYWVRRKYQGQGFATLATKMLIVVGFDIFGSDRIQISHNCENDKSRRVIEKCGFVKEGLVRNNEAARTPEQLAGGLTPSRSGIAYALLPEDLANLAWVSEVRENLKYVYI